MRAKQVTALMMAATLAVTSNGVTALAAPAADAATESAAVAEVTEEEVEESNQTGTFEITPVNGATYKVQVIFVKSGQQAKEYKEL